MLPAKCIPAGVDCRSTLRRLITAAAAILIAMHAFAKKSAPQKPAAQPSGAEIVSTGGEPELRVDGVPFFVHAAQFDYFRVPPDLWKESLKRYRELGINTIDLRIPWNWHEPSEAEFDFDGHSNPRRNLRALLKQIAQMHFKLIVRPGPLIGDHWRNAGYPPWLLTYPDYKMNAADIQNGIAPPDAKLAGKDANAAARDWLANETHMSHARLWMTAVAKELAPYGAKKLIPISEPGDREGETQEKQISGPLLFVALDDGLAVQPGREGPDLARYLSELRGALVRGGLDATIFFINVPDAAVQGVAQFGNLESLDDPSRIAFAGQWFFQPSGSRVAVQPVSVKTESAFSGSLLTTADASSLSFLAQSLGTQENFPPFLSAFAATTFAPAVDVRAAQSSPANTLLASRLLLGSGIRAMVYSPLQDTLTPAGWETTSTSRYFRWDAPLDLSGNHGPRAIGVLRNGQFISAWGAMLAASHVRADFGIVDLRESAAMTDETTNSQYARAMEQLFRVATLAGYAPELVNPAAQSVERLSRNPVIVLAMPQEKANNFQLSEKAQSALVEFVRRGGALMYFPARPQGALLEPLWRNAPVSLASGEKFSSWGFERGRVIGSTADFYSWVVLAEDLDRNRAQPETRAALESLTALLEGAGVHRSLVRSGNAGTNTRLLASQIVSNETSIASGGRQTCVEGQLCAAALVSVTNLNSEQAANESFEMIDPRPFGPKTPLPRIFFNVTVPARESLLLPVHAPLCSGVASGEDCSDEVVVAGTELLAAEREGKTLELNFYAPARALVRLHLESEPAKVELDDDIHLDYEWKQETGELEVHLLRGAAPDFRRVLQVHLRYTPHVTEKPDLAKNGPRGSEYEVFDAIRFPLGTDVTIPTGPPLVTADPNSGGQMVIAAWNLSEDLRLSDFTLDGAFHGARSARMLGNEQVFSRLRFQPSRNPAGDASAAPASDGLLRGNLTIRSGHEHETLPILFMTANASRNSHYQYDFDRDGAPEWVLESSRLRLIVSPADGGRVLALVDKSTSDDLITLGGALHDFLIPTGGALQDAWGTGDFSFNRAYQAEWVEAKQDTSLRLTYEEHDNSPTGIHVEKTLRFTAPETIETAYCFSVIVPPSAATAGQFEVEQSFISMLSVPMASAEDRNKRFCWEATPGPAPAGELSTAKTVPDPHCEDFVPDGAPISLPDGITRMEISNPGRRSLVVQWTSGRAVIVPRAFSAEVNFVVPVPPSSVAPGDFTLRYTMASGP